MGGHITAALWPLVWLAGTALQLQQPALWSRGAYINLTLGALALLTLVAMAWRRTTWLAWVALLVLAFGSTGWRADVRLAERLSAALEGQDLLVTGVVASLPHNSLAGTRFTFDVEAASLRGEAVVLPPLLSLGWYRGFDNDVLLAGPGVEVRAGQRWRITVRLRQPHGSLNPHGFDVELWLFEQGVGASGYVRASSATVNQKLADDVAHPIERARQRVRDAIYRHVSNPTTAGVLAALAIGDQAAIDRDDWELFRITGVAHLMSISGLHVTMFAWLVGGCVARLWRHSSRLMLACPTPMAARWAGLIAAAAYALLAGWGVPAQRTVWMIASVVLLRTLGVRWPQPLVLAVAAAVVCALDPWALMQAGFWLSFVAVALLISSEAVHAPRAALAGRAATLRATLLGGLRTQLVATVGLAPLSMVFFQQISIIGFVANLIAIPLVTLLITPLALTGLLLPFLWTLAAALVQGLMHALLWLSQWPFSVWTAAAAPAWAVMAGLLGGALLIMPLPWRLRLLGVPLMLPLIAPVVQRPELGRFEAVVADVGQGTAVLLRTREHLLVYDAGPQYSPESDAGQRVLLPLLRGRGENKVDLLMLSHRDLDHVGGAASLLARGGVVAMSTSLEASHRLMGGGTPHTPCAAGQSWQWDGVRFEVLHPLPGEAGTVAKSNSLSCVLRVQGKGKSLLLTGDVEAAQELALLVRSRAALASDVLVVPHHGSRTSSTPAFIAAVAPQVAIAQAGYRSRFGHPAPDIVQRYTERGIELVRTDRCGAWTLHADGSASCQRQSAARYWHHHQAPGLP